MSTLFRRRREKGRGQSLVEFTLALPIFLAVLLAIAEGGYYVVATTAVSNATYEGARLGVLASTPTALPSGLGYETRLPRSSRSPTMPSA